MCSHARGGSLLKILLQIPLISHCGHSSRNLAGFAVGNAGFGKDAAMR
jgi:hypothetical protein